MSEMYRGERQQHKPAHAADVVHGHLYVTDTDNIAVIAGIPGNGEISFSTEHMGPMLVLVNLVPALPVAWKEPKICKVCMRRKFRPKEGSMNIPITATAVLVITVRSL